MLSVRLMRLSSGFSLVEFSWGHRTLSAHKNHKGVHCPAITGATELIWGWLRCQSSIFCTLRRCLWGQNKLKCLRERNHGCGRDFRIDKFLFKDLFVLVGKANNINNWSVTFKSSGKPCQWTSTLIYAKAPFLKHQNWMQSVLTVLI